MLRPHKNVILSSDIQLCICIQDGPGNQDSVKFKKYENRWCLKIMKNKSALFISTVKVIDIVD